MDEERTRVGSALELGAVLIAALVVAIPAFTFGVPVETTMESGLPIGLAMAGFPTLFYRLWSPPTIGPRRAGAWGLGNAAVIYLLFAFTYVLLGRVGLGEIGGGIGGEVVAFLGVGVLYFAAGFLLDGNGLPDRSEERPEPAGGE